MTCPDEFFVPALDVISEWGNLSPDVAGATLMAAGGSSPELFTSAIGTFLRSNVGFGAIVGSAVFNVLFVVGVCALSVDKPMVLSWYPLIRDSSYYAITLIVLAIFFGVTTPQVIVWWEALVLFLMYIIYVTMMMYNKSIYKFIMKEELKEDLLGNENTDNDDDNVEVTMFSTSTKFRAGILKLMTSGSSIYDTAGTHLVTKVASDVDNAFSKFDKDGNGTIDRSEMEAVMKDLGCPLGSDDLNELMSKVDEDGNGQIDKDEFTRWFIQSRSRLQGEITKCFQSIDTDNDGSISLPEIRAVLKKMHFETDEIGEEVLSEIAKFNHGSVDEGAKSYDQVTLEAFTTWFEQSAFALRKKKTAEVETEAAEGVSLSPPYGAGYVAWIWYIVTLPVVAAFALTIVDVRQPGRGSIGYATYTFVVCLMWMGFFSYFMVSWVETIGATAQIPSVIMGLTFLAAGTSVPDMLSAVIVAKQGLGNQAVSSSIGSNVFDICMGLAFPWLLFIAVYQVPVEVAAGELFISIFILVIALVLMLGTIAYRKWVLGRREGMFFIFLYCVFVAQQLARTTFGGC